MELTGDITGYVDVAQVVLYVFWLFFFVLIFWLHREGKREGYPLESDMGIGGLRE
ncbi:MAG: photosynthetic reaction center subunit H, partial [Gammaproteobacteria bacterium]|nr:photosynthetic reaction center subunit H [Gammaproteobacteria bacterium]